MLLLRQQLRENLSRRLLFRLRVFVVIWLATVLVIAINVFRFDVSIGPVVTGILLGLVIGIIVSRKYRLSWDEESAQVIAQVDWVGGIILAAYILLIIGRKWIFGHWIHAAPLAVFCLCISAGSLLGRFVGTASGVRHLLQACGIGNSRGGELGGE